MIEPKCVTWQMDVTCKACGFRGLLTEQFPCCGCEGDLRAENERLRAALRQVTSALIDAREIRSRHWASPSREELDAEQAALTALLEESTAEQCFDVMKQAMNAFAIHACKDEPEPVKAQ